MGKNWDWSYHRGREKRLQLGVDARMRGLPFDPLCIPLHSHDGTMQSYFTKGWCSVNQMDIEMRVKGNMDYRQALQRLKERFGESNGR